MHATTIPHNTKFIESRNLTKNTGIVCPLCMWRRPRIDRVASRYEEEKYSLSCDYIYLCQQMPTCSSVRQPLKWQQATEQAAHTRKETKNKLAKDPYALVARVGYIKSKLNEHKNSIKINKIKCLVVGGSGWSSIGSSISLCRVSTHHFSFEKEMCDATHDRLRFFSLQFASAKLHFAHFTNTMNVWLAIAALRVAILFASRRQFLCSNGKSEEKNAPEIIYLNHCCAVVGRSIARRRLLPLLEITSH